jgi:predicted RNA-binding Zn ribbon-like protein
MQEQPAPGDLALLERFVNTVNLDAGTDELGDPARMSAWLGDSGLAPAGADFGETDRLRIVAFREALRELLLANHGATPDPGAIAALDGAARLAVAFDARGTARLVPADGGVDGVLGALVGIVARSQAEGTWPCLKACPADSCGWAFYDHSRNHSRTWCTMSVCGNRAKARSYRARQR